MSFTQFFLRQNLVIHYLKGVLIRRFSGPYFPTFKVNVEQKISQNGHFSRSDSNIKSNSFLILHDALKNVKRKKLGAANLKNFKMHSHLICQMFYIHFFQNMGPTTLENANHSKQKLPKLKKCHLSFFNFLKLFLQPQKSDQKE